MSDSKSKPPEESAVAESKSQQPKPDEEDMISTLPDPLLLHILSFLPTKTSVQTSILSSRWRNVWHHLSVLNFSDDSFEFNDEFIEISSERFKLFKTFLVYVIGVIGVIKPYNVRKMRLSCTKSLTDRKLCIELVEHWIRSVIRPFIEELDLTLYIIDDYCFRLPDNISDCTHLVSLSLEGALCLDLQQAKSKSISLPSLKKLRLNICDMTLASLNAFLHGCPGLETLDLYLHVEHYDRICVPSLCLPSSLKRLNIMVETEVVLLGHLSITVAGKLQNAFLDASNASALTSLKLLDALSEVKHLELSGSATKWLLGGVDDVHFPKFGHLLQLNLILPRFNSNSLMSLLHKCHLLQVLIIQNDKEVCNDIEVCNDKEQSPSPKWAAQPIVPSCLESHLSFIQFKGYRGFPDELLFAEYILLKGLVLKTMVIVDISANMKEKFDNLKRLSKVSRASKMCRLTFD